MESGIASWELECQENTAQVAVRIEELMNASGKFGVGQPWLVLLLVLGMVVAVFWPGLTGFWLFDDYPVVYQNPLIRMERLDWNSIRNAWAGFGHGEYGRPLAMTTFAFNYLVGGADPWGYKLTNLLIHVVNTVLVWGLVRQVLELAAVGPERVWSRWAALLIALIWAIHPLQVSSVLYVVQRMEVLATTFVFASLCLYLGGRQRQLAGSRGGWLLLTVSGLVAATGMLSKETASLAGLYALCLELCVLRCRAARLVDHRLLIAAHAALVAVVVVGMVYLCLKYASPEVYVGRWYGAVERVLTQFRALPLYLGQMLIPAPSMMHFYYDDVVASTTLFAPMTTFYGACFLLVWLGSAVAMRRRLPLYSLGVAWFFAAHLLTSSPINLELVFEHRNYFALLGVVLSVAGLAMAFWRSMDRRMLVLASLVVVVGLGMLTVLRSATWGNGLLLATELQQQNPHSPRASSDLAEKYMLMSGMDPESPFYDFARREFLRGAALPYASPLPETGLLLMAAASGQPGSAEAWASLQAKMRNNPPGVQENAALDSLLRQYMDGLPIDAVQLDRSLATFFSRKSPPAAGWAAYGDFLLLSGLDDNRAVACYLRAYRQSDSDMAYLQRMASSLRERGRADIADRLVAAATKE